MDWYGRAIGYGVDRVKMGVNRSLEQLDGTQKGMSK